MKRQWTAVLLAMVLFAGTTPVFAQGPSLTPSPAPSLSSPSATGGIIGGRVVNDNEKPNLLERTLAGVLISVGNGLIRVFGMTDVVILVFGRNPAASSGDSFAQGDCAGKTDCREGAVLGGAISNSLLDAVDVIYRAMERFVPFPMFFALLVVGLLILWHAAGASPDRRMAIKDYMTAYVLGLIALRYGFYLMNFVAYLVETFVDLIWTALSDHGIKVDLFLNTIWGQGEAGYQSFTAIRSLVVALIALAAILMTFVLNYQYLMRSIMLAVLLAVFPAICALMVFPRFRHSFQIWLEEFTSNMVLSVAHALALGLFFLLLATPVSPWLLIVYFFALPTIAAFVRKLVGVHHDHGGVWGGIAAAAGVAGLISLSKMFRPKQLSLTGTSGSDATGISASKTATTSGVAAEGAGVASASAVQASMPIWKRALPVAGRTAGYGLRLAGGLTGFAVGTMAGNPALGVALGGAAGHQLARGAEWVLGPGAPQLSRVVRKVAKIPAGIQSRVQDYVRNVSASHDYSWLFGKERRITNESSQRLDAYVRPGYRPAGKEFWENVDLNDISKRDEVVLLYNQGKLERQRELEQVFLRHDKQWKNKDYWV